jgi:2-aminoethylphosphonate-pyruvate transaminase
MMKTILLNPGPVNVSARVREAIGGPDLCHREPEYFDLQDAIRARLLQVFDAPAEEFSSVLLTGSGTSMVEAIVSSSVSASGRLLVIQNGVYGERMAAMARIHGIACDVLAGAWTERPSLDAIAARLAEGRYEALAIVHHETTTGLLNDIPAVAALCRQARVRLLVDAVSALGGEAFDFRAWRPDAVACTANKCVQGLPGLSFAILRRECLRAMATFPERTLYLHLPRHHDEQERRSTPFTPAVQVGYALRAALDELAEETVPRRVARYAHAAAIVRDGLSGLGYELLLPPALRSNTITAVRLPRAGSYDRLHDALKREGFVIYAGQGPLAATLFRVATMGDVAESDYRRFVAALGALGARVAVTSEK